MGSGRIAAIGATAQQPPVPFVLEADGTARAAANTARRWMGAHRVPADFPAAQLVTPTQVVYTAADGMTVHAQALHAARRWCGRSRRSCTSMAARRGRCCSAGTMATTTGTRMR